jgi:hypothetical protein
LKLARVLGELAALLEGQGTPYAVVGGLAASARGEARFTRDIDVALMVDNDDQAEQCIHGFVQQGYVVIATVEQVTTHRLATARLRHPDGVVCDLIFATCGIESEVVASAQRVEVFPGKWVTTATAESMIAMKVLSATAKRPLIRYCARPALSMERISETSDDLNAYRLRHAPKGRATHRLMTPVDFMARVAALIPPPRHPLLRCFGVFGPHSSWRKLCVPAVGDSKQTEPSSSASQSPDSAPTASVLDKVKVGRVWCALDSAPKAIAFLSNREIPQRPIEPSQFGFSCAR